MAQSPLPQSVRFTVFSARPISDLAYVARDGAVPQKLTFYPTARSRRFEYRGMMPLQFLDGSGNVAAEAVIAPEIRDALLVFLPLDAASAADSLRYRVMVIDDGALRQAAGGLAILNLSGKPLTGTVNDQNVRLQPGLNPALDVGQAARLMFRTELKGRSYTAHSSTIPLQPRQRALLLLLPPYYAGSQQLQSRLLLDESPRS